MTKPGFIRKRLLMLFETNNIEEQQKVVDNYNKNRDNNLDEDGYKSCYCGHTTTCDCGNPHISEFKQGLQNNSIDENLIS